MKKTANIGNTTEMPFLYCPACGGLIDRATGVSLEEEAARGPSSGAFTVCLICAATLVFDYSLASACYLRARTASASEVAALKQDHPDLAELLAKMQQVARKLVRSGKRLGRG